MKQFKDILVQCIEDIKAGRSTVEDCLDRYPSMREQLEPLLRIALAIREPPDVKPSYAFKIKARVWLMDQIHGRQAAIKWLWPLNNSQVKPIPYRMRFSMASVMLAVVLTLSAIGVGTVYAAQNSLPGDALYPVKLGTEQMIMMLPGDNVIKAELALSFAGLRVGEMEALAEHGRPQDLDLAVDKYGYDLDMTLFRIERAGNSGLATINITALVAEATTKHLFVLDTVYDKVPLEAKEAIAHARNVSETGYFHALAALAKNDTLRAAEINLAAIEGRLNRVVAIAGDVEALETALQQFLDMAEFDEEIFRIAQEIGINITSVEGMVAEATSRYLEVLVQVWERVPEQAKPAIENAMANLLIHQQKQEQGIPDGITPPGQEITPPGQEITPPGQEITPPGQEITPPGQEITPPGQEITPPGQEITPPGQEKTPPGQEKTPPGQ